MIIHQILFIIFGIICVAGAVSLLVQRHPINSALSLVVVMASLALIYLLLGAEFVAAIQVIVYAGAIMVLFVFVIMLLNAGAEERSRGSHIALFVGVPGVVVLAGTVAWLLIHSGGQLGSVVISNPQNNSIAFGDTHNIAHLLFRDFLLPFEITSVLILIAIMGAVVLGRKES
ncbi:MAG TPA: NADH-quinone oxidoreductase subunit J [Candidatus Angelobacter sp.]|nr:NADH-quinone oxidoreductase subunit J [Candidatus Angelobacter sp.]